MRQKLAYLLEEGQVSEADADAMARFVDLSGSPTLNTFILAKQGHLAHLENQEGF